MSGERGEGMGASGGRRWEALQNGSLGQNDGLPAAQQALRVDLQKPGTSTHLQLPHPVQQFMQLISFKVNLLT